MQESRSNSVEHIPSYCTQCISRCGCTAIVENGQLKTIEKLEGHPTGNVICVKGKAAPEMVYHPNRVLTPLKRTNTKRELPAKWQPISWQQAYDEITTKLATIKSESGAESVCWGVTTPSATAMCDSFMWVNRLARAFGSPNVLFATENCNWHKDFSPTITSGQGIGMPDYQHTDCIILWGVNPIASWPSHAEQILKAKKRGAKLIVIDPRKTQIAQHADIWLPIKPSTDGVLAQFLSCYLIEQNVFNHEFIQSWSNAPLLVREDNGEFLKRSDIHCLSSTERDSFLAWNSSTQSYVTSFISENRAAMPHFSCPESQLALLGEYMVNGIQCRPAFDFFYQSVKEFTIEKTAELTTLSTELLQQLTILLADLMKQQKSISYFTWTGTGQQSESTQTARAISCLYGLTGCLDKKGGNVYFNKVKLNNFIGYDLLPLEQQEKTLGLMHTLSPQAKGWINSADLFQSVVNGAPYLTRAMVSFGGNPIATKPNKEMISQTLENLEYYVHCDLFINESANYADIILPVSSAWERSGLYANFQVNQEAESYIQLRRPVISTIGESKSDTDIVFELACHLDLQQHFFEGKVPQALNAVLAPSGVTLQALKDNPAGIDLALNTEYQKYLKQGFATSTKKFEFYSEALLKDGISPVPTFSMVQTDVEYPLLLTTAKYPSRCHSQHTEINRLKSSKAYPIVEMSTQLANDKSIENKELIEIKTAIGSIKAIVKLNHNIQTDTICIDYGWTGENNLNAILNHQLADSISGSNNLKTQPCCISKIEDN
ncbi:molybdopterin-dependent oxidoreductase [Vibrio sp. SS-MA-C1-2]|uniref:molybdopterin-dependent oxidoreductase n=1 Tax=Vibrio sp. SS-MA-C1-2 TaxID=2908646 RepID=UPI001F211FBA|nr:molybdopterin-dependent oxidoreductase [Vibrio sp. SS-MA-C1-2]UJF18414.1 molybdopterin-dependent oxidoreductase [Vibrio sp. SS-MA-C1-2]